MVVQAFNASTQEAEAGDSLLRPEWPSEFQDNQGYAERPKTTTKQLKDLMIGPGSLANF